MHASSSSARALAWEFPLPRPHAGIPLGNGVQGLLVWGDDTLNLTVGRAGFWDHRGGRPWNAQADFATIRRLLEAGDEARLRQLFARADAAPGEPERPTQIGGGRLELTFPRGLRPLRAVLDVRTATLRVELGVAGRGRATSRAVVTVRQAMDAELAWLDLPPALRGRVSVRTVPTWDHVGDYLGSVGCQPPRRIGGERGRGARPRGGFTQALPDDPELTLYWRDRGAQLAIATALGEGSAARAQALADDAPLPAVAKRAAAWWKQYWADVPQMDLPDPALQRLFDLNLYKQAGLSTPGGVPASLQGPWLEEYQIPPWSCDYHFNINVQMVYWPALASNRLGHFQPLWDMVRGWWPQLQENARRFFGRDDALMLPHAVDDRCRTIGGFWTGTIDHACTAWMAQMAWLHYRYSMDRRVLRELAWPMMVGAFNGYWAMLEETPASAGGGQRTLALPVSVSPEYNGSNFSAWGRNASFQLAACHFLAAVLPRAAAELGEPVDPRWQRVREELPAYSVAPAIAGFNLLEALALAPPAPRPLQPNPRAWGEELRRGPRIALWEGKDLDASHRHHSHLGGIYPFATLDPEDPAHREVVANSIHHWMNLGAGGWSGWCVPWAATLHARCGHADAAVAWLHWWRLVFTNEGDGTLHDGAFPGCTRIAASMSDRAGVGKANTEIMQMDAGMGFLTAVFELLVQCRGETLHVLPAGVPTRWRRFRFDGVRTDGAFLLGATVEGGQVVEVRVTSLAGGRLDLAPGLGERWTLDGKPRRGSRVSVATKAGQRLVLRRPGR